MIEVNLLPGHGAGDAAPTGLRAFGDALGERARRLVRDMHLAGAVAAVGLAAGGVYYLHAGQAAQESAIAERESTAVADSARYDKLLAARRAAVADRDSVQRQLGVIAAIDSARYSWAHVLDEVSRSLPAYTWLTTVQQTSAPPLPAGAQPADSATGAKAKADAKAAAAAQRPALAFRLVGQTVDLQALTAFMRDLEASPFVQRVQLARSDAAQVDGKDVTEFTLDAELEQAPRALLRTERLAVPVARTR